jgi:hypothetical protein
VSAAIKSAGLDLTVSKAGQIQQTSASNLSSNQYYAFCAG